LRASSSREVDCDVTTLGGLFVGVHCGASPTPCRRDESSKRPRPGSYSIGADGAARSDTTLVDESKGLRAARVGRKISSMSTSGILSSMRVGCATAAVCKVGTKKETDQPHSANIVN
jgi:hypothetical protein